jgi:hypothetical protein
MVTHIQGYDRVTMYPPQGRRIFSHISYIKKDMSAKKGKKKREHIKSHNLIM